MMNSLSYLTAFDVADEKRPWGKIRDFLIEFPAGKARYFSVDAHVGFGVKEIWAPMETLSRVDPEHRAILVQAIMDKAMVNHLSRLEFPDNDRDELKLHRLYETSPEWVEIRRKKGGPLRKHCRLIRASKIIGFEALCRNGDKGQVKDLLFDDKRLSLEKVRLEVSDGFREQTVDMEASTCGRIYPDAHAIYMHAG